MQFLMQQKATLNIYEHNVRVATREVIFLIYWFFFYPDLNYRDAESVNNIKETLWILDIENIVLEADLNFG